MSMTKIKYPSDEVIETRAKEIQRDALLYRLVISIGVENGMTPEGSARISKTDKMLHWIEEYLRAGQVVRYVESKVAPRPPGKSEKPENLMTISPVKDLKGVA